MSRVRRKWTREEDERLVKEADIQSSLTGAPFDWILIASKIPGRTNKDCRKRWSKICRGINKGTWDKDEDERLIKGVEMYGQRWTQVAEIVGSRHADQCAKRWQNSLDPSVDRSEWRVPDDQRLLAAVKRFGQRWKKIAEEEFPRRSTNDLKNRYMFLVRKRSSSNQISSNTPSAAVTSSRRSSPGTSESRSHVDSDEDSEIESDESFEEEFSFSSLVSSNPHSLHHAFSSSGSSTPRLSYSTPQNTPTSMSHMLNPMDYASMGFPMMNLHATAHAADVSSAPTSLPSSAFSDLTSTSGDQFSDLMAVDSTTPPMDWLLPSTGSETSGPSDPCIFSNDDDFHRTLEMQLRSAEGMTHEQFLEQQKQMNVTLTLEDTSHATVNGVLEYLFQTKTKFRMDAN